MKSSFVVSCAARVLLGVKPVYQAVQHGRSQNRKRCDKREAGIQCEESGEELSSNAFDVANGSHPAEQHCRIEKCVDPLLIGKDVEADDAQHN
jgi:hypothetical protein